MRAVEKRRQEWLLGRCAAKEAVRSLLEDLHLQLAQQIEIVPDPYGRPQVQSLGGPMARAGLSSRHLHRPQPGHSRSAGSA